MESQDADDSYESTIKMLKGLFSRNCLKIYEIYSAIDQKCGICGQTSSGTYVTLDSIEDGIDLETLESCSSCIKQIDGNLCERAIEYANHIDSMIENKNLYREMSLNIVNFIFRDFREIECDELYDELDKYTTNQPISIHEFDHQLEILLNINCHLIRHHETIEHFEDLCSEDYGISICSCRRYYKSAFEQRQKCLNCLFLGYDYRCRNYCITKSEKFNCLICYEDEYTGVFRFYCGHQICNHCCNGIRDQKENMSSYGVLISCPFCRDPFLLPHWGITDVWAVYTNGLKKDLKMMIAVGKHKWLNLSEKCRHRSDILIKDMMKKRDLPIYEYLTKLEKLGLLGVDFWLTNPKNWSLMKNLFQNQDNK